MLLASRAPLPVAALPWLELVGRATVVLKLSYDLGPMGTATLASRGDPLIPDTSDGPGILLFPSDFVRSKSRCDILVVGRALTLPPSKTLFSGCGIAKRTDHVAALGPIEVFASAAQDVQHAPIDQRVRHPRMPLRIRYEREAIKIDATIQGPTPDLAIERGGELVRLHPAIDTIAIDPERARIMVTLRALLEQADLRTEVVYIDERGGLFESVDAALRLPRTELPIVDAAAYAGPVSRRPGPSRAPPASQVPVSQSVAPASGEPRPEMFEDDATFVGGRLPGFTEDETTRTTTIDSLDDLSAETADFVIGTITEPLRASPAARAMPFRSPSKTVPSVLEVGRRPALPFAKPAASGVAPPAAPVPPRRPSHTQPGPKDPDEQTQILAGPLIEPALPFIKSTPPPASVRRVEIVEEPTVDTEVTYDGIPEGPASASLPFLATAPSEIKAPAPKPENLPPATPFDRPMARSAPLPPPAAPVVPAAPPAVGVAPTFAPRPAALNVGFDLKPIERRDAPPSARPSKVELTTERYAAILAEIWAKKEPRKAILAKHGLSELKWRMAERSFADRLSDEKLDASVLGATLAALSSAGPR